MSLREKFAVEPSAGRLTAWYDDNGLTQLVAWLRERNVTHACWEAKASRCKAASQIFDVPAAIDL